MNKQELLEAYSSLSTEKENSNCGGIRSEFYRIDCINFIQDLELR